ncbi:unnamed protein product [Medioppia subpectinata]|uniref:Uncharacterized protein n=1 Tax=Medioppia subpectinata TaxID=1979941 RepID=A0A7R9KGX0_9ACAR|nr:unnamed protein product [Medioppia subpectinata]CAG2103342.1 unnamed protein product [Medioppia subpectinata]
MECECHNQLVKSSRDHAETKTEITANPKDSVRKDQKQQSSESSDDNPARNCPPGLESLIKLDEILVHQKITLSECIVN